VTEDKAILYFQEGIESMYEYPTSKELKKISKWDCEKDHFDWMPFMEYIKSIWWTPEWGWTQKGRKYYISTGGWSGNESIIYAMQRNFLFWSMCWISSRTGGHYIFKLPKIKKARKDGE
jgi:hypothetical protein